MEAFEGESSFPAVFHLAEFAELLRLKVGEGELPLSRLPSLEVVVVSIPMRQEPGDSFPHPDGDAVRHPDVTRGREGGASDVA